MNENCMLIYLQTLLSQYTNEWQYISRNKALGHIKTEQMTVNPIHSSRIQGLGDFKRRKLRGRLWNAVRSLQTTLLFEAPKSESSNVKILKLVISLSKNKKMPKVKEEEPILKYS